MTAYCAAAFAQVKFLMASVQEMIAALSMKIYPMKSKPYMQTTCMQNLKTCLLMRKKTQDR